MKRSFRLAACLAAGIMLSGHAFAQVDVSGAWVRGTVPAQTASGAFMTLHAHEAATLVNATSPVARKVEVHEMKMDGNVMRMRAVQTLDLPAMQAVELKPGGYHIMLMGLAQPLKAGDKVPLTLTFRIGQKTMEKRVDAEVRALNATAGGADKPAGHHHH
ncbi:copper chaperone PCu(A)C [Imbroritus primus]|uniref:Copper chaperone PCu(A)C n=1 Tax=Imbroritus primus TaxID=3058603 RepID=A0ACD3SLD6_9BURK|nr:copper chaperone PCu(A)C [Burkholderiaceae bacterium PBA]